MKTKCGECRKTFTAKSPKAKWCSDRCRKRNARRGPATTTTATPAGRTAAAPTPATTPPAPTPDADIDPDNPDPAALLARLTGGQAVAPPAGSPTNPDAAAAETGETPDEPPPPSLFEAATATELRKLGALESMLGQQALQVARRMGRDSETGAAVASLSREHSRLMTEIAVRAKKTEDPVERWRRERDDVRNGATAAAAG